MTTEGGARHDETPEGPDGDRARIDPDAPSAAGLPADFAFLYDAEELAEIEKRRITPPGPVAGAEGGVEAGGFGAVGPARAADGVAAEDEPAGSGRVRRFGASGAVLAGMMLGVGDALDPEREKQSIIEFAPDKVDEDEQLVTFHMVPGDPRASRLVIRPWLLEHFRAGRAAHQRAAAERGDRERLAGRAGTARPAGEPTRDDEPDHDHLG